MSDKKLWSGRFSESMNERVEAFSASVDFDQRLAEFDIAGSKAHANMLCQVGVLTEEENRSIQEGLEKIRQEIVADAFPWTPSLEDVHMNIESRLTDLIGDAGKKLHTGRSRNDQVATDFRLYVRQAIDDTGLLIRDLQTTLLDLVEKNTDSIMPGFTHMQIAQPVTFGHHLLAWFEMLDRDRHRLLDCRQRVNTSPLGAAALAGTTFPIDRQQTADALAFESIAENSLDAVSDRDFAIEFNFCLSVLMLHLSRMCEEMILWASSQFDFIELGDAFCTGSSIMPQKKNPDVAELVRGKTARVFGNLSSLMMLVKSQPLAYNRDNQEDKEPVFDSIDTVQQSLVVFAAMVPAITVNRDNMLKAAVRGYSTATDLAEYLVRKHIPFRDAHEIVGKTVRYAIGNGLGLAELKLSELAQFSSAIEADVFEVLTVQGSVKARDHLGGSAPAQVREALSRARGRL